jgi:hypothetical protein
LNFGAISISSLVSTSQRPWQYNHSRQQSGHELLNDEPPRGAPAIIGKIVNNFINHIVFPVKHFFQAARKFVTEADKAIVGCGKFVRYETIIPCDNIRSVCQSKEGGKETVRVGWLNATCLHGLDVGWARVDGGHVTGERTSQAK